MPHKSTHQHTVRGGALGRFFHEAAWEGRLIRMFGLGGSRGARKLVREDRREYLAAAKRGHHIRTAQRRRQRGRR